MTEADVLALNFLSITSLANVAIDTTITYALQIRELLEQIPADILMHSAPWSVYEPGAPAVGAVPPVRRQPPPGDGVQAAGPQAPPPDPGVRQPGQSDPQAPASPWNCLWNWFHTDPTRASAVAKLRKEAGGIEDISPLRCLDVILWMRARRG
ncbi:Uncharacterised protein [Amycolatopsis camponoti]|uniref:Uncharacterized protein n=1 Tax=Amycolatopsis camponoti TaxID=2606593 RepID=A0A6I8LI38_9PSEU|nr:DUF6308 family protein [Amycolatopsis camponoti]VVJ15345.1 Uncharacterised protein [Amycolatopsis camponoti]